MRILLVDDSRRCEASPALFPGSRPSVPTRWKSATDARALEKWRHLVPELILCDWNMPVMDGLEFVQTVRKTDQRTPIIMVTTESEMSRIMQAIRAA